VAEILGASIKLVADDTRLRAQIDGLKADAQKFGQEFIQAYQAGMAKGGPAHRRFAGPEWWESRLGGGGGGRAGLGGGPGGIMGGPGGGGEGPGGRFGGLGRREIGHITRAAGLGEAGRLAGLAKAHPYVAIAAGAVGVLASYVKVAKEAADAQRELTRAQESGDPAAVNALLEKRVAAVRDLTDAYEQAHQPVTGLESRIQRLIGTAQLAWEAIAGPGLEARKKQVEDATKAAAAMWEAFGAPKLAVEQLKRSASELQAVGQAAIKAAEDTMAYSAAVNILVMAKQQDEKATEQALQAELDLLEVRRKAGTITVEEYGAKVRDIQQRVGEARRKLARETKETRQDERHQLAEMAAAETEYTAKSTALAQERRDAIVQTLGQIVEIEAATTLSLEQAYRARGTIIQEGARNALEQLKTQADAQRAALQQRIEGAQGQERVRLERELTLVTEQENTKRAQIEEKYLVDRLRLYRQAQQEQIALQERVFAIQRMLSERTLQDDLSRQTAIARGAQAGSQTQIKALEQVASLTKALSDQAKEFLTSALAASDELARKAGREPSKFVSFGGLGTSLAEQTATRFAQLTEAERVGRAGGMVSREDFEALMRGELDKLRTQREAGLKRLAQNVGQFGGGIPRGDLTRAAFGEQIAGAFEKPIDTFTAHVGPQFASMVDKAKPEFLEMSEIWAKTVDTMVKKTEDGTSKMEKALYQNFKAWLARDLDREVKTF
jgi:hypothetical protein